HPDYASTRFAEEYAAKTGSKLVAVQHHHAHMASCMAEHELTNPVIGVIFDGTGLGLDGAIWGGEFLVGDYRNIRRAAHLRYVPMPSGEQAIRQPWRMAISHLDDAGIFHPALEARLLQPQVSAIRCMIEQRFHAPPTSSVGRLFDAIASIAGLVDQVTF